MVKDMFKGFQKYMKGNKSFKRVNHTICEILPEGQSLIYEDCKFYTFTYRWNFLNELEGVHQTKNVLVNIK